MSLVGKCQLRHPSPNDRHIVEVFAKDGKHFDEDGPASSDFVHVGFPGDSSPVPTRPRKQREKFLFQNLLSLLFSPTCKDLQIEIKL